MALITQATENQQTAVSLDDLPARPTNDVERAAAALAAKISDHTLYLRYYDGDHPQIYTNKKLQQIFRDIDIHFNENWSAAVIDTTADRIQLTGADLRTKQLRQAFNNIWRNLSLDVEADDCHLISLVTGEAYLIGGEFENGPDVYYNDPRLCHVFYRPDRPKIKQFAAKWWHDESTDRIKVTLYYPKHFEYYVANQTGNRYHANLRWTRTHSALNPHQQIPVWHFRPERRRIKSDLTNAIPIQIGINKLVNDLMVTAEWMAFPQRFVISQSDTLDQLTNSPNEIWGLIAGDGLGQDTEAGQFNAADPASYIKAIDHLANAMATITRTPKHVFFGRQANISGEALLTMENPLQRKIQKRIDRYTPEWRDSLAFVMRLSGHNVSPADIQPHFQTTATQQPFTLAQTRAMNKTAGIPITNQLRSEGWTEQQLKQLESDIAAEREALAALSDNQAGERP